MAYDLQTARQAAQQRGERPPGGEAPGTPEYDQWVMQWFEAGVNAGDPDLVRRAGGTTEEEVDPEAGAGGIAPWQDAAGPEAWMGKRMPTPGELRKYYAMTGKSEDFRRYPDRVLAMWLQRGGFDINSGTFAGGVEKPTETGGLLAPGRGGGGGGGGYANAGGPGGGGGGYGGGGGGYGGAPGFGFTAPTWEEAMAEPGYQFALQQGQQALENSALARGVGRTSGTIKDLLQYNQDMATQQYGNVYGRQYQLAKDKFAPLYGSWETKYGGDLQKYLQREGNIYGLINQPMPQWPTYGG